MKYMSHRRRAEVVHNGRAVGQVRKVDVVREGRKIGSKVPMKQRKAKRRGKG